MIRRIVLVVIMMLCISTLFAQDTIRGTYTYTYGDSESLVDARQTCKDLALREAIESYAVFVESSTMVQDFQLKEDIIHSISTGYLTNVKIVDQKEEGRTITISVEALVNAEEVKKMMEASISARKGESGTSEAATAESKDEAYADASPGSGLLLAVFESEKRLKTAESAWQRKNYDGALREISQIRRLLENRQPKDEQSFSWKLYQCALSRTLVIYHLVRVEQFESQGARIRARASMNAATHQANELRTNLAKLEKVTGISERQNTIRKASMSRCRQTLEDVAKKSEKYRRR